MNTSYLPFLARTVRNIKKNYQKSFHILKILSALIKKTVISILVNNHIAVLIILYLKSQQV